MKPYVFTDQNFRSEVLGAERLVLVDFWASWCGPCKMMNPIIEELARAYDGKITIGKLNVDENPQTALAYVVRSIPTLLIFKNGDVIEKLIGAMPKSQLETRLNTLLQMQTLALDQVA
jgi:thioredoxin 1